MALEPKFEGALLHLVHFVVSEVTVVVVHAANFDGYTTFELVEERDQAGKPQPVSRPIDLDVFTCARHGRE